MLGGPRVAVRAFIRLDDMTRQSAMLSYFEALPLGPGTNLVAALAARF